MPEKLYDFATQRAAISGRITRDYEFNLQWLPQYLEEFPQAMNGLALNWEKCKFIPDAQSLVPDSHGVYCFSINLGQPFPKNIHIPLYIGKAAPGYLSERFNSYFDERRSLSGRPKVVVMLNKYRNKLFFWWAELPRIHVDAVEEHLLMCCKPPCNERIPSREKLWGKAFD